MKILMINVVCGVKSTGRICTDVATALEKEGHEVVIAYGRESVPEKYARFAHRIGTDTDVKIHGVKARILDNCGFNSKKATVDFVEWIKEFDPDIIHLHNLHGYYIHVGVLFEYLRTSGKRIIWTFHDCWAFTGHCSYFDYAACDKWKTACSQCVQKREYPESKILDQSKKNHIIKKKLFSGIPNMEIVTPSEWLRDLVKESFLKEYKTTVINNGINTDDFRNRESLVRSRFGIGDKKMILGVAAVWNRRKGMADFIRLSQELDDHYVIVLVGLTAKQIETLPSNVIGISRTNSVQELAELYSAADVFVNPTYEDNYPTTNIEAISCGTPVISYKTGGSVESAQRYGVVVEKGDTQALKEAVISVCNSEWQPLSNEQFDISAMVSKYLELYAMGEGIK